jgi:hypothetical protein
MGTILDPVEILQIHKDYADEFAALAQTGLTSAFGALSASGLFDYTPTAIIMTSPEFGVPNRVGLLPVLPLPPELPEEPELDNYVDVPNADYGAAPNPRYGEQPDFSLPGEPTGGIPQFTTQPPTSPTPPTMPLVPVYLPLPSLLLPYPTVTIPPAPVITDPVFDGVKPDDLIIPSADTIVQKYLDEQTDHRNMLPSYIITNVDAFLAKYAPEFATVRTQINNAILTYTNPITGGGVGIPANIEGAIMARTYDRTNIEFQRAIETATETVAKMGYTIPNGAVLATVRNARTAMGDAVVRGSTEVATKNLELEQQNFQFMLKLGEQLEEKMFDVMSNFAKLTLEIDAQAIMSAKEIVTTYLGAYNLQVMVYKALWEGYTSAVEIYKARIQANESLVRVYEAEIKAELAKTEVNKSTVDVLNAVANVNRTLAESYKAQVDAALAPLEIAKVQASIFEAQVRGFVAQVQAYEAQWGAYKAQIEGKVGEQKGYEAQVSAYVAEVQGYKAEVEAYGAKVGAVGDQNRAVAASNEARTRTYSAIAEAAIKIYEGLIAGYSAESGAVIKNTEIEIEYWRTASSLILQQWTVATNQTFEYAREQMNLFRGQMESAISAGNGLAHAAQVAGSLASGAMTGLTTFAGSLVSAEQ